MYNIKLKIRIKFSRLWSDDKYDKAIQTIKLIRELTGFDLKEAKELYDTVVMEGIALVDVEKNIKGKLSRDLLLYGIDVVYLQDTKSSLKKMAACALEIENFSLLKSIADALLTLE